VVVVGQHSLGGSDQHSPGTVNLLYTDVRPAQPGDHLLDGSACFEILEELSLHVHLSLRVGQRVL